MQPAKKPFPQEPSPLLSSEVQVCGWVLQTGNWGAVAQPPPPTAAPKPRAPQLPPLTAAPQLCTLRALTRKEAE